jgi:hypothetical protein
MPPTVRELLAAPKEAVSPARTKRKAHPAYRAWDITLSVQMQGTFIAWIRTNVDLPEEFSIGLRYQPLMGPSSVLLRVNGDHGRHRNPDKSMFEEGPHVHAPTEAELDGHVEPGMWQEGPPFATVLPRLVLPLGEGWRIFAERANIVQTEELHRAVARLSTETDQSDFGW